MAADAVALTRALVAMPSVNPRLEAGGAGESAVAVQTAGWLETWGFEVELVDAEPGRASVLAVLRRGPGPRLVLNGHLDTVGVEGMAVPPFSAELRDGRLWGRGSCDMKSGVAALLAAARDAASAGEFRGELTVALVADEEHASIGMQALIARGLAADAAVVCEPTGLAIMPAHKGFTWLEVEFRGRAAHGSRPDRGIDAIRHAGRLLARLDALEARLRARPAHPLLGHGSVHAGTIRGGTAGSVYPASCALLVERRTLPDESAESTRVELIELLDELRSELPQLDATVRLTLERPGSDVPADAPVVRALDSALRDVGIEPVVAGMTAWVDAALLNRAGIPAVCFGPGSIEHAHSAAEYVDVAEIEAAHRVLGRLIHRFLSADA